MLAVPFQDAARKYKNVKGVVRGIVEVQSTMFKAIEKLKKEVDELKRVGVSPALSTPTASSDEFALEETLASTERQRIIGGRKFPLNSEDDMRRFCEFWRRSEHNWSEKKRAKKIGNDDDAERTLGKPDHRILVHYTVHLFLYCCFERLCFQ